MKTSKTFTTIRFILSQVLFLLVILGLLGCNLATQSPAEAPPATNVTVQLAWIHTIEYSGFYMAEEKGYYADENLSVELRELGSELPVDQVVAGEADFGLTSADNLILARAQGVPAVAIATVYQRSPVAFISLANGNIVRPQDLIGKDVMVDLDGTTGIVYRAMLNSQSIDLSEINTVPRTDFSNDPLLNGQVAVMDAYINNQPVQLEQQGHAVNAILASDYGIDVYPNVIFTSEDMIANEPDLVERFLRATLRGLQDAVESPEEAAELAVARNDALKLESEAESMQRALPLLNPAGSQAGMMQPESWQITHEILLEQGILSEPLDVDTAYNLTFLDNIYSK